MNPALRRIFTWTAGYAVGAILKGLWSSLDWRVIVIAAVSGAAAGCAACIRSTPARQAIVVGAISGFVLAVLSYKFLGSRHSFPYHVAASIISGVVVLFAIRYAFRDAAARFFAPPPSQPPSGEDMLKA